MTRRLAAFAVLLALALPLSAQRRPPAFGGAFGYGRNVPYDGRFTIVRLWYARYPGWSYDYPEMEQNVTNLLPAISARLRTLLARAVWATIARAKSPSQPRR